tara:strand:- start:462 stop:1289 length:828 start_codon:yes stop_codon:yes gene_type:complete
MFNMDYLLCQQAECAYEQFIGLLDTMLELPLLVLEQLRSMIKQLEVLIVSGIVKSAEDLLGMITNCLKLPKGIADIKGNFCDALFNCEFLYKSYLPEDGNLGGLTPYEWIKQNICGDGLSVFLNKIKAEFRNIMQGIASDIVEGLGIKYVKEKIQDGIDLYQKYLLRSIKSYFGFFPTLWNSLILFNGVSTDDFDPDTANIYDLIDFINQFANCIFSVCNLAESVANKILDIEKKASIDIFARRFTPGKPEIAIFTNLDKAQRAIDQAQSSPCFF